MSLKKAPKELVKDIRISGKTFDLNAAVDIFRRILYNYREHTASMDCTVAHLKQQALPSFLFKTSEPVENANGNGNHDQTPREDPVSDAVAEEAPKRQLEANGADDSAPAAKRSKVESA